MPPRGPCCVSIKRPGFAINASPSWLRDTASNSASAATVSAFGVCSASVQPSAVMWNESCRDRYQVLRDAPHGGESAGRPIVTKRPPIRRIAMRPPVLRSYRRFLTDPLDDLAQGSLRSVQPGPCDVCVAVRAIRCNRKGEEDLVVRRKCGSSATSSRPMSFAAGDASSRHARQGLREHALVSPLEGVCSPGSRSAIKILRPGRRGSRRREVIRSVS